MQPVARARDAVEEARRAGLWRARQQAGAKPSRLSRQAYLRGRVLLTLVFLVLLLAPLGFILAVQRDVIALCGPAGGSGCIDVEPALQQLAMIGSPLLAALIFVIGNALMTVRRANDLDEHLSFGKAIICSLGRYGPLQRRLNREEGTQGTNRFGLMPPE